MKRTLYKIDTICSVKENEGPDGEKWYRPTLSLTLYQFWVGG
jgi:hypothetical protein